MSGIRIMEAAAAGVIVLWIAAAAFLISASRSFDMAAPSFIVTYWAIPVVADLLLIAALYLRSRWRPHLERVGLRARSLLSAGLLLCAALAPFAVAAAIAGAAAAIDVMAEDRNRFVGTALVASVPIFLLALFALALAILVWPRARVAAH